MLVAKESQLAIQNNKSFLSTFEETKENIKDAIHGYLEVLREDGDEIPIEHVERIAA